MSRERLVSNARYFTRLIRLYPHTFRSAAQWLLSGYEVFANAEQQKAEQQDEPAPPILVLWCIEKRAELWKSIESSENPGALLDRQFDELAHRTALFLSLMLDPDSTMYALSLGIDWTWSVEGGSYDCREAVGNLWIGMPPPDHRVQEPLRSRLMNDPGLAEQFDLDRRGQSEPHVRRWDTLLKQTAKVFDQRYGRPVRFGGEAFPVPSTHTLVDLLTWLVNVWWEQPTGEGGTQRPSVNKAREWFCARGQPNWFLSETMLLLSTRHDAHLDHDRKQEVGRELAGLDTPDKRAAFIEEMRRSEPELHRFLQPRISDSLAPTRPHAETAMTNFSDTALDLGVRRHVRNNPNLYDQAGQKLDKVYSPEAFYRRDLEFYKAQPGYPKDKYPHRDRFNAPSMRIDTIVREQIELARNDRRIPTTERAASIVLIHWLLTDPDCASGPKLTAMQHWSDNDQLAELFQQTSSDMAQDAEWRALVQRCLDVMRDACERDIKSTGDTIASVGANGDARDDEPGKLPVSATTWIKPLDENDVAILEFLNRRPNLRRKMSDVLPDTGPQDRKAVAKRLRKLADRTPPLVDYPKDGRSGVAILPAGVDALKRTQMPH